MRPSPLHRVGALAGAVLRSLSQCSIEETILTDERREQLLALAPGDDVQMMPSRWRSV